MVTRAGALVASAVAGLALAPAAAAAELQLQPTLELSENWSDNPTLVSDSQAHSQFITEVSPGFTLAEDSNRLQLRASYKLNLFAYSDRRLSGSDAANNELALAAKARLVGELLYVDVNAGVSQQPVSPFAPVNSDADYLANNRSEVRSYSVSPYLTQRFGSAAVGTLRYTHDVVSSSQGGLGNSDGDSLALSLSNGPALRRWGWDVAASRQNLNDHIAPTSDSNNANFGVHFGLSDDFSLLENLGYDKFSYESGPGAPTQGKSWSTGFKWEPSTRTSLQMTAGRRYYGPSYGLNGMHRSRHTVWSLSYNDAVTTSRDQFLLPSSVDTAALLNSMLTAQIPDPVQRAAAVAAFIRSNGLPASLANSINYFSNRYILQKEALATAALNGAHATLLFSLFRTRRTALSSIQEDSELLGSQNAELYDNTNQVGASIVANYSLNSRTSSALSASYGKTDSLSLQQTQVNRSWRWMVSHQFQPRLSGVFELRQTRNVQSPGDLAYTEHAVAVSISMKF
jgi:uncharacterized protein (PEP-CTERM system associated)